MDCPKCGKAMTPNGKNSAGKQRWACRRDRGGCGHHCVDSPHTHGGHRHGVKGRTAAQRMREYRKRKKMDTLKTLIDRALSTKKNFDIYALTESGFSLDDPASVKELTEYKFFADAQWVRNYIEETGNGIDLLIEEANAVDFKG